MYEELHSKMFENWLTTVQTLSKIQEQAENNLKEMILLHQKSREQQTALLEEWLKQIKNLTPAK
ncbi:MAG TPA: hypothetical protein VHS59_00460 [Bacillota bacterium]|nr:hypothetical protein [Bacillota bacterium]